MPQNLLTDPETYQGWKDSPQTQAYLQVLEPAPPQPDGGMGGGPT
jgi:hypothetical protein